MRKGERIKIPRTADWMPSILSEPLLLLWLCCPTTWIIKSDSADFFVFCFSISTKQPIHLHQQMTDEKRIFIHTTADLVILLLKEGRMVEKPFLRKIDSGVTFLRSSHNKILDEIWIPMLWPWKSRKTRNQRGQEIHLNWIILNTCPLIVQLLENRLKTL